MPIRDAQYLLSLVEEIYAIEELDSLLEAVLTKARRFLRADAGTLYLKSNHKLFFSFIQNDSMFSGDQAEARYVYSSRSLKLDGASLAGYVAKTGESVMIDDVYDVQSDVDYSFNPDFDRKSNYRTKSMLIVPLKIPRGAVVGVLQLINAMDESGNVVPFSRDDELYLNQFAQYAASAIEKARLSKEMVLRMVDVTSLHDPFETAQHAKRVGAYSVELFDKWATRKHVADGKIARLRDYLKTAAMLHDIGKVAISDSILKRRGTLTLEEHDELKKHTVLGGQLFRRRESYWDVLSRDVAERHHEHWDGTGYPGDYSVDDTGKITFGPGKKGTDIPWSARIVAIADVYDALRSQRVYKEAWSQDTVFAYIQGHAGTQFDPMMVGIFLGMRDVVESIRRKYSY
ncbi:MAG: GAF domain-containing protein [Spirochaeta sp.]|nr:GAF domain-containing protein [Spirochaeta sp.]